MKATRRVSNSETMHSETMQGERGKRALRLYGASAVLACACLAAFMIDRAVAEFVQQDRLLGDVKRLLNFSELFAHGAGVATILLTCWTLDPANRRRLVRVAACAYGAGLTVDVLKPIFGRTRPYGVDLTALESIWSTFSWPSPLLRGDWPAAFEPVHQSLPSGHTATAVGLAVGLSVVYPRGAVLFGVFALAAGLQRLAAGAHFPSDVAAGAAVGVFVGALWHDARWAGRFFDRWENIAAAPNDTTN